MTSLSKRLDRLEAHRGKDAVTSVSVVYMCGGDGQAWGALLSDGSGVSRLEDETEAAFRARVEEKVASINDQRGDI